MRWPLCLLATFGVLVNGVAWLAIEQRARALRRAGWNGEFANIQRGHRRRALVRLSAAGATVLAAVVASDRAILVALWIMTIGLAWVSVADGLTYRRAEELAADRLRLERSRRARAEGSEGADHDAH